MRLRYPFGSSPSAWVMTKWQNRLEAPVFADRGTGPEVFQGEAGTRVRQEDFVTWISFKLIFFTILFNM